MFSDHQLSSTQRSRAAAHQPSPSHGRKYRAIIKRQLLLNHHGTRKTYPLLSQLPGTLILAVSEQFNDTTFIWCKTVQMEPLENCSDGIDGKRQDIPRNLLDDLPDKCGPLAQVALGPRDTGLDNSSLGFL
jgi:hypothetical protein